MDQNAPLLEVKDLCKSFGALVVADRVSLALRPGARHALIGPNGAGKTTLVNLITGTVEPSGGTIVLGGHDVTRWPQARRVKQGLARTFQINTLFRGLSVLETVAARRRPCGRYRRGHGPARIREARRRRPAAGA